jgi:hypothetical protein
MTVNWDEVKLGSVLRSIRSLPSNVIQFSGFRIAPLLKIHTFIDQIKNYREAIEIKSQIESLPCRMLTSILGTFRLIRFFPWTII